jgi:hypothetical protein
MFYARINKIKVFNNREGFLGLFNSAEVRIYGYVTGSVAHAETQGNTKTQGIASLLTLGDLADLPDDRARRERLQQAVSAEVNRFSQSVSLEINGVKDNQSLLFGDTGFVIYQNDVIPDTLHLQLWVIEADEDVRNLALDVDTVLDSDAFKGLLASVGTVLAVTHPVLTASIAVGGIVARLLREKLRANKDDLVGYWQTTLNRAEHYPHGLRDRQDTPDTTGNILVDYTIFGVEN